MQFGYSLVLFINHLLNLWWLKVGIFSAAFELVFLWVLETTFWIWSLGRNIYSIVKFAVLLPYLVVGFINKILILMLNFFHAFLSVSPSMLDLQLGPFSMELINRTTESINSKNIRFL